MLESLQIRTVTIAYTPELTLFPVLHVVRVIAGRSDVRGTSCTYFPRFASVARQDEHHVPQIMLRIHRLQTQESDRKEGG